MAGGTSFEVDFCLHRISWRVPRPCVFCKGGYDAACTTGIVMLCGLHRICGAHHLHFIACSCYPLLWRRSFAGVGISVPALAKKRKDGAPSVLVAPQIENLGHPPEHGPTQRRLSYVPLVHPPAVETFREPKAGEERWEP